MQRIINTANNNALLWRGDTYLVDGQPGTVEEPLALLTERWENAPEVDPETELATAVESVDSEEGEYIFGWNVRDLTPEEIADRAPKPGPVTRRQFWLALLQLLSLKQSDIEALYTGNDAALIEIRDALEIDPNHPLVTELATQLEKTPEEIDALFLHAATL